MLKSLWKGSPKIIDSTFPPVRMGRSRWARFLSQKEAGLPRYIINFPTVREPGASSHLMDIESGMDALVDAVIEHQIESVAIPALGAGAGKLTFDDVRDVVKNSTEHIPEVGFILYRPHSNSGKSKPRSRRRSRRRSRHSRLKSTVLITIAATAGLTVFSVVVEILSRGFITGLFNLD